MGLIRRAKSALRNVFAVFSAPVKTPSNRTSKVHQLRNAEFNLTARQIQRLIAAAATPRDALLIYLLSATALRRQEIADLCWEDVDSDRRLLVIRRGKGGKMRIVPITTDLAQALAQAKQDGIKGPVFRSRQSGQISVRQLNRIVAATGNRAGIAHPNPRYTNITCHLLRHSFARRWKAHGGSIESLSKILGHSSVKTTWDCYGTESLADVQHNYHKTVGTIFRKGEK